METRTITNEYQPTKRVGKYTFQFIKCARQGNRLDQEDLVFLKTTMEAGYRWITVYDDVTTDLYRLDDDYSTEDFAYHLLMLKQDITYNADSTAEVNGDAIWLS